MNNAANAVAHVMAVVRRYGTRHPEASDTIDGIIQWWLPHGTNVSPEVVQAALDRLVAREQLHRTIGPDGTVRYSARGS